MNFIVNFTQVQIFPLNISVYPSLSATKLVFSTAAIVIIHDPATKTQKYFMDHSDDVVAICIDSTGWVCSLHCIVIYIHIILHILHSVKHVTNIDSTLCASGQPTSIDDDGRSRPPIVYIWDLATLAVLRTIDVKVLAKVNIQRSITGLSFSNDSSKLFIIGADDKHTVSMFDITESPAQILEDSPGQVCATILLIPFFSVFFFFFLVCVLFFYVWVGSKFLHLSIAGPPSPDPQYRVCP